MPNAKIPEWRCPRLGLKSNDQVEAYMKEHNLLGFVYENEVAGRKYIGKKLIKSMSGKAIPWKQYVGSNSEMMRHKKERPGAIQRTILDFGKTRNDCSYKETLFQIHRGAIFDDSFMNSMLHFRINSNSLSPEMRDWRPW